MKYAMLPLGLLGRTCKVAFGPATAEISRNAAFLVEACDCPQGTLAELARNTPAWLIAADGDSVPMRVVVREDALIQQALLRPARLLRAHGMYALHIPGLLERKDVDAPSDIRWRIQDRVEESMVGFKTQPQCPMSAKALFGEVPHSLALIEFQPLEAALYWIRVRIEDEWAGEYQSWIVGVAPGEDRFSIGWPTRDCGPGMDLIPGIEYKVSLTLYGADGAVGRISDPIRITMEQ
jgi:hypothetical protein